MGQFPPDLDYPEASKAQVILGLGIFGLWPCFVLGPIAWWMGSNELAAIDAGRRPPDKRATANAGRILGIISSLFYSIFIAVLSALFAWGNT